MISIIRRRDRLILPFCFPINSLICCTFQTSVNINIQSLITRFTPLHVAADRSKWNVVECLVGWGAALNLVDRDGNTPLHCVIKKKCLMNPESPQIERVLIFSRSLNLTIIVFCLCRSILTCITAIGEARALSGLWRKGSGGLHCSGLLPGAGGSRLAYQEQGW